MLTKYNNPYYKYLPLHIAILIPIPGRFVFGLTLVIEELLLVLAGTLANSLINQLKLKELKTVILMMILISTTILFRQILVATYTEIALSLGFLIYLQPISLFIMQLIYKDIDQPLLSRLKTNILQALGFSFNALIFFIFRDIAGFGTFTFFSKNHMISEKVLFSSDQVGIFTFFASLPGVLVLSAALLLLNLYFHEKIKMIKRVERQNDLH